MVCRAEVKTNAHSRDYIVKSVGEDDTVTADAISVNGAAQKVGLPDVLQYKQLI